MFEYRARVVKVIDGDTIDLEVDLGFRVALAIRTRVLGVDTPEVSTAEGRAVRDILRNRLPPGAQVTIRTQKDPGDKYGRWLAAVLTDFGDLAQWLIAGGMARRYDGGTKA